MSNNLDKTIRIGYLSKVHALKGELKVVFFNESSKSLKDNQIVFLVDEKKNDILKKKIESIIYTKIDNRIKFFEINSKEHAEKLRGLFLEIYRTDLPELKKGEYYLNDLLGFSIYDESKNKYGIVINVFQFPANDVLVTIHNDKEQLIPLIDDVIVDIKHDDKIILIDPISGLLN